MLEEAIIPLRKISEISAFCPHGRGSPFSIKQDTTAASCSFNGAEGGDVRL
jgi:hypothetical protein